jgi:hypothetical protein
MKTTEKILLDEKAAAQLLSISWRGLAEYRKRRLVPFVKLGRRILYRPERLIEAIERLEIREIR